MVMVGRSLLAGLVGPVLVVMAGLLAEDRSKVPFVVDEHQVGALGSCGAYPSVRVAGRAWCLRWGLDRLHALAGEDLVEGAGELGVAVPDEEAEGARSPRSISRLRACWAVQGRSGWAVTPRTCTCRVATSMTNSTHRRLRKIVSTVKEVAGQQSLRLHAQERLPGGVQTAGGRPVAPRAQDPPHGRFADVVAEPG